MRSFNISSIIIHITDTVVLALLACSDNWNIRLGVAKNPNALPETLAGLAQDEDEDIRRCVAENQSTPPEVLAIFALDKDKDIRRCVAENPNTPADVLAVLKHDEDSTVRKTALDMYKNRPPVPTDGLETKMEPTALHQEQVADFHRATDTPVIDRPAVPPEDRRELRIALLQEEFGEVVEAMRENDVAHVAKELADLLYVAYGAALEWGVNLDKVFDAVHESNMAKVGTDGKVLRRKDGKILKPDGWREPDIGSVLH